MNKLAKAAMLAAAGIFLGAQGAHAAYLANDLVLGFNRVDNGGVGAQPADYVINLGHYQTSVGVGGTAVVDLTSMFSFSSFSTLYGTLGSGVTMSVVGGNGASNGRNIFATVARNGLGTPSLAGSLAPDPIASAFMASGANDVGAMAGPAGLNLSSGNSTIVSQSDANSFNTWILGSTPPSYFSGTGIDPRGATTGSVLYEDLYRAANNVNGNAFAYLGYFTLDLSGSPSLTFTASSVPEPSTYGLILAGGLLLISTRRQLKKSRV